jgi:quinolinate synthase
MKMNTLEKIKYALVNEKSEVIVGEELRKKALVSLQRMMDITSDKPVVWPDHFSL